MEIRRKKKKNDGLPFALGIFQICAGIPLALGGFIPVLVSFLANAAHTGIYMFGMTLLALLGAGGGLLLVNGIRTVNLLSNYHKLLPLLEGRASVRLAELGAATGQKPTFLVRDLRALVSQGFFPEAYVDLDKKDFVLEKLDLPGQSPAERDSILVEGIRVYPAAVYSALITVGLYAMIYPFGRIADFVAAAVLGIVAGFLGGKLSKPVVLIKEKPYNVLPPPAPVLISTGNEALDELYTESMRLMGELGEASLLITNPVMQKPLDELMRVSRQIFAFVEKNPNKIRHIRQFVSYYLPTTVKLLQSYSELAREPYKGENIKKAMARIEESIGGVADTFNRELDSLYGDKAMDITVDLEVMQSMMRSQGIAGPRDDQQ